MSYVEKRLILRNGPPWGFRLVEDFMEGLMVSKVRRRSPAEIAGVQEGDHVLVINGIDALDMSHAEAVQIIDYASYTLEVIVGRYEKQRKMETVYLDNRSLRSKQIPQEITTTELQLFWEKEMPLKPARRNWPPPEHAPSPPRPKAQPLLIHIPPPKKLQMAPPPKQPSPPPPPPQPPSPPPPPKPVRMQIREPSPEPIIVPHDPEVSRVSVKQLMREFDVPPIAPELKKKNYADSSFYSDPARYYPTIEEQIQMARKVADSLQDPYNIQSKGANMFEKQRQRAEKHVKEGPEPEPDPIEMATLEELELMVPPTPPPPPPPPPPSFPGLQPTKKSVIPPPPPMSLPPGQPKTVQEFLEKIKIFPKNSHADLDPQKCFDIATALYTSDSRGAKMFAKRHARAKKWDAQAGEEDDSVGSNAVVKAATAPGPTSLNNEANQKIMSKITQNRPVNQSMGKVMPNKPTDNITNKDYTLSQWNSNMPLTPTRALSPPKPPEHLIDSMPKPFILNSAENDTMNYEQIDMKQGQFNTDNKNLGLESKLQTKSGSGWRPVKFKIGQAAN